MTKKEDYDNFVVRMGSFEDDAATLFDDVASLTHHGIKGMHWGVKRSDKQLDAQKKTLDSAQAISRDSKNLNSAIAGLHATKNRKETAAMSDAELRERVNRMNLEQQYNNLSNSKMVSGGHSYVQNALDVFGSVVGIASSATAIALTIRQLKG